MLGLDGVLWLVPWVQVQPHVSWALSNSGIFYYLRYTQGLYIAYQSCCTFPPPLQAEGAVIHMHIIQMLLLTWIICSPDHSSGSNWSINIFASRSILNNRALGRQHVKSWRLGRYSDPWMTCFNSCETNGLTPYCNVKPLLRTDGELFHTWSYLGILVGCSLHRLALGYFFKINWSHSYRAQQKYPLAITLRSVLGFPPVVLCWDADHEI